MLLACGSRLRPCSARDAWNGRAARLCGYAPALQARHRSHIAPSRPRWHVSASATDISQQKKAESEDVEGSMLDPSLANKNQVRLLAVAVAVLLTARSTEYWSGQAARTVHLLAYGTWLGSLVWTTFFAGITMFKNLPRQVFGRLQAKLFPLYFLLAVACITLQLGTLAFVPGSHLAQKQLTTLGIALAASVANGFIVEPMATESMFKRYQLENQENKDAERIKALRSEFGKLHGLSSTLNLAAVVTAVSHGWWLASRMVLATGLA